MSRRWAVVTMVASTLVGVVSVLALVVDRPAGAGTLAPLTAPTGHQPVVAAAADERRVAGGAQSSADNATATPAAVTTAAVTTGRVGTTGDDEPVVDGLVAVRPARLAVLDAEDDAPVPVRLQLPDGAVDAPVDPVGVEPDGSMTVPEDVERLGWYRYGATPGDDEGSAVIAGHVDSRAQGPGAFFDLADIQPGERVVVELSDGSTVRYEVVGREQIGKADLPTEDVFRETGPGVLTLITCGGDFDDDLRSYADNVVVVAVEVS